MDAYAGDPDGVAGDVATLEWIRDRIAHSLAPANAERIDALLGDLRSAADNEDLTAAAEAAVQLQDHLTTLMG